MKNLIKNILLAFGLVNLIFITSCNSEPGSYLISGNIDTKDGLNIYRIVSDGNNQARIVDSAKIEKNKFLFKGTALKPSISFLRVENYNFNLPVIIEEGDIKVKIFKDNLGSSKIYGTPSNDHFTVYKNETRDFVKAIDEIRSEIQLAAQNGDKSLTTELQNDYNTVQEQIYEYEIKFIKSNLDSYLSIILLERFAANKKVLSNNEIKEIFDSFTQRIKNSDKGVELKKVLENPNQPIEVGSYAPNFNAPTPDGEILNLNDKLGKVTLLEFWASWCGPCRRENPNLVKIYNTFKDKGFEIIGVSLDRSKAQWTRAISDDYLTWNHVSNLKFWQDPIAKLYKVNAIPVSFILDDKGRILAKNLRGSQLYNKISELLNTN